MAGQVWWEFGGQPAWARRIVRADGDRITWRRLHDSRGRTCNASVFRDWIKAQGARMNEWRPVGDAPAPSDWGWLCLRFGDGEDQLTHLKGPDDLARFAGMGATGWRLPTDEEMTVWSAIETSPQTEESRGG